MASDGYERALARMHALARFGVRPGLEAVRAVLAELGHPERRFPSLQIAGTNFGSIGQLDPRQRFVTTRFFLQGSVEVAFTKYLSGWALIEGAPFQGQRQAFTDKFSHGFPTNDFPFYGRAGITGKF